MYNTLIEHTIHVTSDAHTQQSTLCYTRYAIVQRLSNKQSAKVKN